MKFIPVITKDGSTTFYNEDAREHYHTLSGAINEAEIKHLGPAKEYIKNNSVIIDFCFGLGYNSIVTMDYAKSNNFNIKIIAFENDFNILLEINNLVLEQKYDVFRKILVDLIESPDRMETIQGGKIHYLKSGLFDLILYVGDGIEMVKKQQHVDVVYFDPFSPKKVPMMWSKDVFLSLFNLMNKKSILTTYSCSKVIRNNMLDSGFIVLDGPVFGRLAPGTIAIKK